MRPQSGEQPQPEKQALSPNDSIENRLSSQGREVGSGHAIFSLGDQSTYSDLKLDSVSDRSSLDSLSFLGGPHEMLNRVSIQPSESAEVPSFLEKLSAAQRPSNGDLVSRLQAGANKSLIADANRTADQLAMQEVGQAFGTGTGRNKSTTAIDSRALPPGGVDVLNGGTLKKNA